jgi:hypothetical protein
VKAIKSVPILFISCILATTAVQAEEYYLSTQGHDTSAGTIEHPFATLQHSLNQLSVGDILYVRGGIYFEDSVVTSIKGTEGSPIVIQSYPGERAVFDGGIPDYREFPNEGWDLFDAGHQVYRTKQPHPGDWPAAWLIDADTRYNNVEYSPYDVRLLTYQTLAEIRSSLCGPNEYLGPGITKDDDGYIYIRLDHCAENLVDENSDPVDPIPAITDPNQLPIAISRSTFILQLDDAAYVEIRDIDFHHATNMTPWHHDPDGRYECGFHPFIQSIGNLDISNGSNHITVDGVEIIFGCVGLTINGNAIAREGPYNNCHHLDIRNCHIYQGFADHLRWRDVKGGPKQAWPEYNSFAFTGELINSTFNNNMIHHTMDGLYIKNGTIDSEVRGNYFWWTRDDAINFETYVDRLEVCHNILRHVYEGISVVGYPYPFGTNGGTNGDIYIHHNVIDVTRYMRREHDAVIWDQGKVWGSHSCNSSIGGSNPCPYNVERFGVVGDCGKRWTVYNNTIIATERDITENQNLYPTGCKEFANNIIYVIDDMNYNGCGYCDGNIYWRLSGGNCSNPDVNGVCIDPGFFPDEFTENEYGIESFDFYKPMNDDVLTPGVSLPASWPESQNDYRGAFGVLRGEGCFSPDSLRVTDIGSRSANLIWTESDSALSYDIRYRMNSSEDWIDTTGLASTSILLEKLTPNTKYDWRVRAVCPMGNSVYQYGPSFTTMLDSSLSFVSIDISDSVTAEAELDPVQLSLRRDNKEGDLLVYIEYTGTASSADFEENFADSLFFSDGDSVLFMDLIPKDDLRYEGTELLVVKIEVNYQLYNILGKGYVEISIIDNDNPDDKIAFTEQSGEVVIEGEHFHSSSYRFDISSWSVEDQTNGYLADGYVTVPDGGSDGSWSTSCEISYNINFSTEGLYRIWLRRYAIDSGANSVWVGMNNTQSPNQGSDDQNDGFGEWVWKEIDSVQVSPELHTLQIRRREAGYQIDRILMRISDEEPIGEGPVESHEDIVNFLINISETAIPSQFALHQNHPNPFNPKTIINYELPITNYVNLSIYNLLGERITTLVSKPQQAGYYKVEWDASGFPSGIYICKITAGTFNDSIKMILLK